MFVRQVIDHHNPQVKVYISKVLFFSFMGCILFFSLSPSISLTLGLFIGLLFTNPYSKPTKPITKYLLQLSVIGLGFGMHFDQVMAAGKDGFVFTILTISAAMGLGFLLGRILKVDRIISYLISCGTAICGGSAIGAISQLVNADEKDISVSLATIFILNAVALFIFPPLGLFFHLTQEQFGIWAAIAIHDTSSVVGAAAHYGDTALQVATTVKLARALWIIPLALLTSFVFKKHGSAKAFPYFILFFIIASLITSYTTFIPEPATKQIIKLSKVGFSVTLYLIGMGISVKSLKAVGARPLVQGVLLWLFIIITSLFFITH